MPESCEMSDGPTLRPLAEPLQLAALEMAELARLGDGLQDVIARLAARSGCADPRLLGEAQAADLLSQRLEGMAAFLRALARAAPPGVTTDVYAAVMDLTVAEQARRLSGPHPPAAEQLNLALDGPAGCPLGGPLGGSMGGEVTLFGD